MGDLDQQLIAHLVALGVVDGFEIVQVQQQQGVVVRVVATAQQGRLHPIAQQAAVGQLCQRVVIGQLVDGFGVGVERDLHGLQCAQGVADFVAAPDVDGRIEFASFNVAKHFDDMAQRTHDGANQQHPAQTEQGHRCQQGADRNPPSLLVALHPGAVAGLGGLELQVDQGQNFGVGAFIQSMGARRRCQHLWIVQGAQGDDGGRNGLLHVAPALHDKAFGQDALLRRVGVGLGLVSAPQLVDAVSVAL